MTTRVEQMKKLKAAWERAPTDSLKNSALQNYEAAQKSNVARMERAAIAYLKKAEASFE